MPALQLLRAGHASAVLGFERANREYFAASISDRGDDYFDGFAEAHRALLAEQDAGAGAYYVLVTDGGEVLGRFNLYFTGEGAANLGYRVAQDVAGRGVATASVAELCVLASRRHGVRILRAGVADGNIASRRVLEKNGFLLVGPADPADIGGANGWLYERDLTLAAG